MLKQATLLPADYVMFDEKELLFRKEAGISMANYEEYFLLSIDNELTDLEKNEVEKFILKHPKVQEEYTLLQQTKLEPAVIEFHGKETLYRTEKKERRIIPIQWMRISAAAAVVGLIATVWFLKAGNTPRNESNNFVSNFGIKQAPKAAESLNNAQPVTKDVLVALNQKSTNEKVAAGQISHAKHTVKPVEKTLTPINKTTIEKDNTEDVEPKNELASVETVKPIDDNFTATPVIAAKNSNSNPNTIKSNLTTSFTNNQNEKTQVKDAVYREIDNTEEDDNTLYIGGAQINKTKLKALFKKAANIIDRKIGRNDSEKTLQIASFEIKSK